MKLAVVGTGMIVDLLGAHLIEWGCDVAAIVGTPNTMDRVSKLVGKIGSEGCKGWPDYAEMLASTTPEEVDAIYVAVPNFLHYSFCKQALEAGRNVIVEKPMCSNAREAEELAAMARERQAFFFEAITTLYQPTYKKIGELLPRIGTVERYDINPELQWENEFRAFAPMMGAGDLEGCYRMLDQSLLVSRVQTEARQSAGVVFPADEA